MTWIVIKALLGPAAVALVLGAAILGTKLREPYRNPTKLMPVVDARTLRVARVRARRCLELGERRAAYLQLTAARVWLQGEINVGPPRHRARRAAAIEQVELELQHLGRPSRFV